jgi:hypothetical protein
VPGEWGTDMTNAAYFAQRERAERALAQSAAAPNVRDIHLTLAARYAELAKNEMALHNRATARVA